MAKNTLYGIACTGESEYRMISLMQVTKQEFDRQYKNMLRQYDEQKDIPDTDYPIEHITDTQEYWDGLMTVTEEKFCFGQCMVRFVTAKLAEGRTFRQGKKITDIIKSYQ